MTFFSNVGGHRVNIRHLRFFNEKGDWDFDLASKTEVQSLVL